MERGDKQHIRAMLETLPDEALAEVAAFVDYLQYKYRERAPASPAAAGQERMSWKEFVQIAWHVHQELEEKQKSGELLPYAYYTGLDE
jgi:hypothetical protein